MPPHGYLPPSTADDNTPRLLIEEQSCDRTMETSLDRFEILERLGYGSSGSTIFKALDRWDNLNTVAIKKVPLATLSDNFKVLGPVSQQDDVDYFISCIADHSSVRKAESLYEQSEEGTEEHDDDDDDDSRILNAIGNYSVAAQRYENGSLFGQTRQSSCTRQRQIGLDRIIKCLGYQQTDCELWLCLEFCGGGSVADLIRLSDGPLTESEIGWIMRQILQGLSYLHSKDHVHGDIKASNILLTIDGHVKLGGSGSVMNHKEGAGERKRRRRSLTMTEFPASWLAPESSPSSPTTPTQTSSSCASPVAGPSGTFAVDRMVRSASSSSQWTPRASTETDVWALGVACIELSQGRPPKPETPILALFSEQRLVSEEAFPSTEDRPSVVDNTAAGGYMGWNSQQRESFGATRLGMSEEMWSFIARCLTPEPEARPSVQDLLEDPFIRKHNERSAELLARIQRMMEFVDQCASISSDMLLNGSSISSSSSLSSCSPSLTLSPSKASYIVNTSLEEASIGSWFIPMVRPRVDSVYDASSFFDEAGLPMTPLEQDSTSNAPDWKHQRISHPVVKQALMCEQAGYMLFRHSRSPSLATIVESQLEEDKEVGLPGHKIDYDGDVELLHDSNSDADSNHTTYEWLVA